MLPEGLHNLGRLVHPEQPVVHEHAGQAIADGPVDENCRDRGIHPAAQCADHAAVPHLPTDLVHATGHEGAHVPGRLTLGDLEQEVGQNVFPLRRMDDLGVELDAEEGTLAVPEGGVRGVPRVGQDLERGGEFVHLIPVAHPDLEASGQAGEQVLRPVHQEVGRAVFTPRRPRHLAAAEIRQDAQAVADPQDRHAQVQDSSIGSRGIGLVDAGRAAREDQGLGSEGPDLGRRHVEGMDL